MVKKKTNWKKSTPRKPRKPKNLPPLALFAKANEVVDVVQKLSERDRYKVLGLARDVLNEEKRVRSSWVGCSLCSPWCS